MTPTPPEILVVDDDRPLRSLLVTILKRHGFSVDAAGDGEEALERLIDHRFQLVLLDLMMPRMNGYELLEHLSHFERQDVPAIVVLSGSAVPDETGAGLVTRRLLKPFDVDALIETVRSSLAQHSSEAAAASFERLGSGPQPTVN